MSTALMPADSTLPAEHTTTAHSRLQMVDAAPPADTDALGLIWFAGTPAQAPRGLPDDLPNDLPCLNVTMPLLDGTTSGELWLGKPVLQGDHEGVRYRADDELLFGVIHLDEGDFASASDSGLRQASESGYNKLFSLLQQTGYPHLWRTWNYVARINASDASAHGPLERYRQFNIGRQNAFDRAERPADTTAPAACGLGSQDGPLAIAFMAGRTAPELIENPRQVSAYHYPDEYGPRSPTFSRAALARTQDQYILFISGTASIVGHRSIHLGDVRAQTRETITNIDALIAQTAKQHPELPTLTLADLVYRVYVRDPNDLDTIRDELKQQIGPAVHATYVQADVCRQELLVEIEATGFLSSCPSTAS